MQFLRNCLHSVSESIDLIMNINFDYFIVCLTQSFDVKRNERKGAGFFLEENEIYRLVHFTHSTLRKTFIVPCNANKPTISF